MKLDLDTAQKIVSAALDWRRGHGMKPITVAVLDSGGFLIALAREDGTSNLRPDIAQGKARGAIGMGLGSRALFERAQSQPYFIQAMNTIAEGSLVPGGDDSYVVPVEIRVYGRRPFSDGVQAILDTIVDLEKARSKSRIEPA